MRTLETLSENRPHSTARAIALLIMELNLPSARNLSVCLMGADISPAAEKCSEQTVEAC
ncbi:MAG: hypothetical protein AAF827_20375 [Cyanobacteria bacterium P01_D01_bin.6]